MGLSFTTAGPRQRSYSHVRIPRESRSHFTVSDLRLPPPGGKVPVFISPRERMAQLYPQALGSFFVASYDSQGYGEVFDPASKRVYFWEVKITLRLTISQSVSVGVEPHLGLMTRYLLLFGSCGLVFVGRPLWREDGSVFFICSWPLPAQSFSGPSPLGLATIFYCLRFETSLYVTSYDSQSHGGGIWPHLHTGLPGSPQLPSRSVLGRTDRLLFLIQHRPHIKRRVQEFLYCCVCIRCRGKVFTESLPSNDRGIFTEMLPYQRYGIYIHND
jgi:hypothetical protein